MIGANSKVIVFRKNTTTGEWPSVSNSLKVRLVENSANFPVETGFGRMVEEHDAVMRAPWIKGNEPNLKKGDLIRERKSGRLYTIIRITDTIPPFKHRRCALRRGKMT